MEEEVDDEEATVVGDRTTTGFLQIYCWTEAAQRHVPMFNQSNLNVLENATNNQELTNCRCVVVG